MLERVQYEIQYGFSYVVASNYQVLMTLFKICMHKVDFYSLIKYKVNNALDETAMYNHM